MRSFGSGKCGLSFEWFILLIYIFIVGNQVKLPGPSQDRPNVYDFGTPYEVMYNDLINKDKNL